MRERKGLKKLMDRDCCAVTVIKIILLWQLFSIIKAQPQHLLRRFLQPVIEEFDGVNELVFYRVPATGFIHHIPYTFMHNLFDFKENDRVIFAHTNQLAHLTLATETEANGNEFVHDIHRVQTAHGNYRRVATDIGFDTDMVLYFVPNFRSRDVPNGPRMRYRLTIERDEFNNAYVMYPFKLRNPHNPNYPRLARVQLWVRQNPRVRFGNTLVQLFERYGFFSARSNVAHLLPNWLFQVDNAAAHIIAQHAQEPEVIFPTRYALTVQWTPGACMHLIYSREWVMHERCNEGKWGIHGLWSDDGPDPDELQGDAWQDYEDRRTYCNFRVYGQNQEPLHLDLSQEQRDQIRRVWFTLKLRKTDDQLWHYEWCAHGRYMFEDQVEYMNTAVELFRRLNLEENMRLSDLPADDRAIYPVQDFVDFFRNNQDMHGATIDISCQHVTRKFAVINEIRFCYDADYWPVDCVQRRIANCHQRHDTHTLIAGLFHPTKYELFPYLVLTIVRSRAHYRRLNAKHQATSLISEDDFYNDHAINNGWKIQKLCPSFRYTSLISKYKIYQRARIYSLIPIIQRHFLNNNNDDLRELFFRLWPNFKRQVDPYYFWSRVWRDCGTVLRSHERLDEPFKYIDTTVQLFQNLRTDDWPGVGAVNSPDHFSETIRERTGAPETPSFILDCKTLDGVLNLVKVRVCYDLNLEVIPCPFSERIVHTSRDPALAEYDECVGQLQIAE